jgi:serine/threonine protein kinase
MTTVISQKYEVLGPLGQGSIGTVYKVRHTSLKTILALKELPADLMKNPEMVARFTRAARVLARLYHPNLVRVIDFDRDDSRYYLVMEYIEGKTLQQYLREKGPLPLPEVLDISRPVAGALASGHKNDPPLVHRALKPANIMIEDHSGRVVVMDLGLAQELDRKELDATGTGGVVGTVPYSSPEQLRHEPLDGRADIYALGLVMYEMYAGSQFFAGLDEAAVLGRVLYDPQEHEPSFARPTPAAFTALITKAIAKNRQRRYQQMEELLRDIEACRSTSLAT